MWQVLPAPDTALLPRPRLISRMRPCFNQSTADGLIRRRNLDRSEREIGKFLHSDRQPKPIHQALSLLEDLLHLFRRASHRRNICNRVVEHGPADLGRNHTIARLRKSQILSRQNRTNEHIHITSNFLSYVSRLKLRAPHRGRVKDNLPSENQPCPSLALPPRSS